MPYNLEQWVKHLSEDSMWYMEDRDMAKLHAELHAAYGAEPNEAIIPGEQRLSEKLRSYGYEHRYNDELSKQAGTYVENTSDPTVDEARLYSLSKIDLLRPAVNLVQDVGGGSIYMQVAKGILSSTLEKSLLKMLNKRMPPGLKIKAMPGKAPGEFAKITPLYDLKLAEAWGMASVSLWSNLTQQIRDSASAASLVFKRDKNPTLDITIVAKKETKDPNERYVLGVVLEPETPDKTKTLESDADIYSAVEIEKACNWWAEHTRQFAYMHSLMDGRMLDNDEIVVLQNYIQNPARTIAKRKVKAGSWLVGARINDDAIWEDVKDGDLSGWSAGMAAMAGFEEA